MVLPIDGSSATAVLASYGIDGEFSLVPGSGTANANARIATEDGAFFLRRRNPRYSAVELLFYDHGLRAHLDAKGVPTPPALPTLDGVRWRVYCGDVYELFRFVDGDVPQILDPSHLTAAGAGLSRFHSAASDYRANGKDWPRYRDPADIRAGLERMRSELVPLLGHEGVQYLENKLVALEIDFPDGRYQALPRCVVHGDWHPGNILYRGAEVCGIFDLDWASRQPRLLDLVDGLFLFAGLRENPLDAGDIRSLTSTWLPSVERWHAFVSGYESVSKLDADEWEWLIPLVEARWLTCRFLGSSKLPADERASYVATGLLEPLIALDSIAPRDWRP